MNFKRLFTPLGLFMLGVVFSSNGLPQYLPALGGLTGIAPLLMVLGALWYILSKARIIKF